LKVKLISIGSQWENPRVRHFGYLAMLAFTVCGSFWLELLLHVGVFRQGLRLAKTVIPVAIVFLLWDIYAVSRHEWSFDSAQLLPLRRLLGIPLEELLFFLIVPVAAILTLEAVLKRKPQWRRL
jgi:lycopene cyclase domain-containing protein